jgi:hypothetical protein
VIADAHFGCDPDDELLRFDSEVRRDFELSGFGQRARNGDRQADVIPGQASDWDAQPKASNFGWQPGLQFGQRLFKVLGQRGWHLVQRC